MSVSNDMSLPFFYSFIINPISNEIPDLITHELSIGSMPRRRNYPLNM